ncbi:GTPase IMAP family member 4-like, partial [Clarias magur]
MQMAEKEKLKASSTLHLILIGEEWTGKSSAGNTMLGRNRFITSRDTEHVMQSSGSIEGRNVNLIDTPGWDFNCSPDVPLNILKKAYTSGLLRCPSFHVLLLTIPISQDQTWNQKVVQRMLNVLRLFNDDMWNHTMLLFTRSNLLHSSEGLEEYLEGNGKPFQSLVKKCKQRYHAINNHAQNDCKQVRELLEKIEQMMQENNGQTLQLIVSEQEVNTLQENREMMYGCSKMEEHKDMQTCLEDYMFKSLRPEENDSPDTSEQNELQGENRDLAMSREDNREIINTEKNTLQVLDISWDLSITCDFYACDDVSNPQSIVMIGVLQISVCWRKLKPSCQTSWVSFTVCGDDIACLFIIVLYLLVSSLYRIYKTYEGSNDTGRETMKTLVSQFGEHHQERSKENQGAFHSLLWLIQNNSTASLDDEEKREEQGEKEEEGGGEVTPQQSNKDEDEKQIQQVIEANENILQFKMDDSKAMPEHEWNKYDDEDKLQQRKRVDDGHLLRHDIMEDGKQILQRNNGELEQQSNTNQPNLQENDKFRNNSRHGGLKKNKQKPEMVEYQRKICKDDVVSKHIVKDMEKIPLDSNHSKQDILQDRRRKSNQAIPQDNRRSFKLEKPQDNRGGSKQEISQDNTRGFKQEINQDSRRHSKHEIPQDNRRDSTQEIPYANEGGSKQEIAQDKRKSFKQEKTQDNKRVFKQDISQDNRGGSMQEINQVSRKGCNQEISQDNTKCSKQETAQDRRRGSKQEMPHNDRSGSNQQTSHDNRRGFTLEIPQDNRSCSKQEIPQDNTKCSKQETAQDRRRGSKQEIPHNNRSGSNQQISHDNRRGFTLEIPQHNRSCSKQEIPQDNRRGSKQGIPKNNRGSSRQEINQDNKRDSKHEIPKDDLRGSRKGISQDNRWGPKQDIPQNKSRGENEEIIPQYTSVRGAEAIKETPGQQVEGINLDWCKNQQTKDISNFTDVMDMKESAQICQAGRRGQAPGARAASSSRLSRKDAGEEDTRHHRGVRKIRRTKSLERFIEFN